MSEIHKITWIYRSTEVRSYAAGRSSRSLLCRIRGAQISAKSSASSPAIAICRAEHPMPFEELRKKAEEVLKNKKSNSSVLNQDMIDLIEELNTYQIELEIQNKDLRRTQILLEESNRRFASLYHDAPAGYLTLSAAGMILQANEAAASFLGRPLFSFIQASLIQFVHSQSRNLLYEHCQRASQGNKNEACEVAFIRPDGTIVFGQVQICLDWGSVDSVRLAVIDITQRKRVENQLKELTAQLEKEVEERTAKMRELAKALTQAEQQERQRLSSVLHDSVQQDLIASRMLASLMKQMAPERIKESAEQMVEFLDDSIEKTRVLSAELSPPILQKGGLGGALKWLSQWMNKKHGLVTEVRIKTDLQPLPEFTELLFQEVRELLLNVVKHAQTNQATIILCASSDNRHIEIEVKDKGKGFKLSEVRVDKCGLLRIRERLSALGGKVALKSSPGMGTSVRLLTPAYLPDKNTGTVNQRRGLEIQRPEDKQSPGPSQP